MRITLRLIISLVALITTVVLGYTVLQVRHERSILSREMQRQASEYAQPIVSVVEPLVPPRNKATVQRMIQRLRKSPVLGLAVFGPESQMVASATDAPHIFDPTPDSVIRSQSTREETGTLWTHENHLLHTLAIPLGTPLNPAYTLVVVQPADHISARLRDIWKHSFLRLLIQALIISLATLFLIRWNITGPLDRVTEWLKNVRKGEGDTNDRSIPEGIFGPLAKEVSSLAHSLFQARAAAEEEARLRQKAESLWTPERLREHAKSRLLGKPLFVVSNREPCVHQRKGKEITWSMPASGLVTAIEPILKACGGTWVAQATGDADKEVVDAQDRIRVPPDEPQYTLRRLWLTEEEEAGFYYGFSNEGLWPLCHIAHTRPIFRAEDWQHYQRVNQKFADVLLEEMKDTEEPWILVQDYHFALLPRMIKKERPDARVAVFWHIPWPNPESFGICPWQRDILNGMLGADLLGFHTQFHCNNFLDTVDRVLESNIDWERFTVRRQGHVTLVKPFPISVAFTGPSSTSAPLKDPLKDKVTLLKDLGIEAQWLGVGVDRIDYTKGLVERFHGIERLLEKYPDYVGKFTFVELGAPSRSLIRRYQDLMTEVETEIDRINKRFETRSWKPIVFLKNQHSHSTIEPYYKAADLCLVTSLHDGMNLVAKEFVSARDDDDGVLILSRFTGASRELRDALLVNPYDTDQLAEAMKTALQMPDDERSSRMHRLREQVRDRNIFRWAADFLSELAAIRLPLRKHSTTPITSSMSGDTHA